MNTNKAVPIKRLPAKERPKKEKTRSPGGCRECKLKKKGCDRDKPTCRRCNERGLECIYDPIVKGRQRQALGGSSSSDLVEHASQLSLGPPADPDRATTSEATSAASSPASMTFDTAPEPGPYLKHFREVLAPILVFRNSSNPLLELVLPLASDDSVLRNAFCMVADVHRTQASRPDQRAEPGLYSIVIQGLRNAIKDRAGYQDSKLAVNVLLCYFEMIQSSSLSASNLEIHLHGASKIILPGIASKSPVTAWLEKTLYFFDVLRSLAYGSDPMTTDENLHQPAISQSGPMAYSDVDPFFGVATSLWPVLRRLALVVNLKQRLESHESPSRSPQAQGSIQPERAFRDMHQDLDKQKGDIWASLQSWEPPAIALDPKRQHYSALQQSIVAHANACKAAALLHMLREVYEIPMASVQVQSHAISVIAECGRVLSWNGPTAGLLWPLFVASLNVTEAAGISDAQADFSKLYSRRQANNILAAWRICQEIWNRRSMGIRDVPWEQVASELDVAIVFG